MGYLGPQACKHVIEKIHDLTIVGHVMDIRELDLNGGTFKVNFPYHWIGWLIWVIGLLITLV